MLKHKIQSTNKTRQSSGWRDAKKGDEPFVSLILSRSKVMVSLLCRHRIPDLSLRCVPPHIEDFDKPKQE